MFRLIGIIVVLWWVAHALGLMGGLGHVHVPGSEMLDSGGSVIAGIVGLILFVVLALLFGLFKLLLVVPVLLILLLVGVVLLPVLIPLAILGVFAMVVVSLLMGVASVLLA